MSRRVTTKTEIKNIDFLEIACKSETCQKAGIRMEKLSGNVFRIQAGRSSGTLNLETGEVEGDSDHFHDSDLGPLRMAYAEQSYLHTLRRQGATVQSRSVNQKGEIVLIYQTA